MVLGHGAGGQGWSVEIVALTEALTRGRVGGGARRAAVAGGRAPGGHAPEALDAAWVPILASLTSGRAALPRPLVVGGRSAGARVACRTAVEVGADAVLCLSFPLHPPGKPESSRAEELLAPVRAGLPVHVVQGERDPFGTPDEVRAVLPDPEVVSSAKGSHSFGRQPEDVVEAVREWLRHTHG